jgi:Protein of unknown function (DUF1566)/Repeat of unknown function (DUF5648)
MHMPYHTPSSTVAPLSRLLCALSIALLTACGGSSSGDDRSAAPSAAHLETAESEDAAVARSAALNTATLAAAEKKALAADEDRASSSIDALRPGQAAPKSAYTSGAIARKALAERIAAYRFYNRSSGAHFYTVSEAERDNVIARLSPPFSYEGPAFSVASAYTPGLIPVHRFYNTRTGVHFYTISEAERAHVVANLPFYTYEGVAYHASEVAGTGLIPFYRFFVPSKGFHFYTASEEEKNSVIANLGAVYRYEGIGYHVLDEEWSPIGVPHTGISNAQCYRAGSNMLQFCGVASRTLNPKQDGDQDSRRMSYSSVPNPAGGPFKVSSCLKDEVTGLIWEGKEATGNRAGNLLYTNQGGGAATDASGYLAAMNASRLCGFGDWRLPTRQELLTIVDYHRPDGPMIIRDWFVNTERAHYWSSDALSTNGDQAWYVNFAGLGGSSSYTIRSLSKAVRLVRGSMPNGSRFSFNTIPYGSDAANNIVNDAWTGLRWRRCEQGRVWNGAACTGSILATSHEGALDHARQQTGWRMPNIKELASLTHLGIAQGPRIDAVAFPGVSTSSASVWSTTPYVANSDYAWNADFVSGVIDVNPRANALAVRLLVDALGK